MKADVRRALEAPNISLVGPLFLEWIADRLVNVYGEDPNVDFVLSLRAKAQLEREALTNDDATEVTIPHHMLTAFILYWMRDADVDEEYIMSHIEAMRTRDTLIATTEVTLKWLTTALRIVKEVTR